jgi:hypothetical protein
MRELLAIIERTAETAIGRLANVRKTMLSVFRLVTAQLVSSHITPNDHLSSF